MAFVVEDGTGLADANAYITAAFADSYFSDRSVAAWTGTDAVKQAAIIRATDYIETVFGDRFLGYKNTETADTQALSFPRNDETSLPTALKKACAEYALRALTATLLVDPTITVPGQTIVSQTKKVGPIETSVTFSDIGGMATTLQPYPAADLLLKPLLRSSNQVIRN